VTDIFPKRLVPQLSEKSLGSVTTQVTKQFCIVKV